MVKHVYFPQTDLSLQRYPETTNPTLQAWDAADELLLSELARRELPEYLRILIIHDSFGALSCALHRYMPHYHHDSLLAENAMRRNLQLNNIPEKAVRILPRLDSPAAHNQYDVVLVKMPKQQVYLEYLLHQLRFKIHTGTRIIIAGMCRHIPGSTYALCSQVIGPTSSSKAVKKARLLYLQPDNVSTVESRYAARNLAVTETWRGHTLVKLPNTFARRHIDVGSRLLADSLPKYNTCNRVLDIGCGNGFIALAAAEAYPDAKITGIDESYLAVESAKETFRMSSHTRPLPSLRNAEFLVMDGGDMQFENDFNLIVCNPPFHEQGAVNRRLALRILLEAQKHLASGGEIFVVANTSLGYQGTLKSYFPLVEITARRNGYMVIRLAQE
ncbi:MAG: methyltransferase [Spirochaeta sp.]